MPVNNMPIIPIGINHWYFGIQNLCEFSLYNEANFIPNINSHRYCKKKLFQIRSSDKS